jgi:hypothetical protein
MSTYIETKEYAHNDKIYCNCDFVWKDNLKKLGFSWQPAIKKWCIPENKFTENVFRESQKQKCIDTYFVYYQPLTAEQKEILGQISDDSKHEKKKIVPSYLKKRLFITPLKQD